LSSTSTRKHARLWTPSGGYKLAILSNGSPKMLVALVHASDIARLLADVISVDRAKTYKPDPKCYELVSPALHVANHEVLFVSSNSFDVAGANVSASASPGSSAAPRLPRRQDQPGSIDCCALARSG